MNKAVGLIRVSTENQAADGCSLILQREKIEAYCKLNDLELIEMLEEAGISGRSKKRESLDRVKEMVESGEVQNLVCYKLDRLTRSLKTAIEFSDYLDKKGVTLHSVTEKIDTSSPQGRLFFNLMNALSSFECDLVSFRTREALRGKKDRNEVYNHPTYGMDVSNDGKSLVVNSEEQKVIRRIRKLHKEGKSYSAIARTLNDSGIQTKQGKSWTFKQVSRIVTA